MTAYTRGNAFERKIVDQLEHDGYTCWQSRGSKTAADIIAIKPGQLVLVQAKSGVNHISGHDWNRLLDLARSIDATAVVADRPTRGVIRYRRITAHKTAATQLGYWPAEPWHPDTLTHHAS